MRTIADAYDRQPREDIAARLESVEAAREVRICLGGAADGRARDPDRPAQTGWGPAVSWRADV